MPVFPPVSGVIYLSVPFWFDRTKPVRQKVIRHYYGSDSEAVWGVGQTYSRVTFYKSKVLYSLFLHSAYSSLCQRARRYCKLAPDPQDHVLEVKLLHVNNLNRDYEQLPIYIGSVQWEV
jgi:hypothetical protein